MSKEFMVIYRTNESAKSWFALDTYFQNLEDAREAARHLIDYHGAISASIGEYDTESPEPPTFNLTYHAELEYKG